MCAERCRSCQLISGTSARAADNDTTGCPFYGTLAPAYWPESFRARLLLPVVDAQLRRNDHVVDRSGKMNEPPYFGRLSTEMFDKFLGEAAALGALAWKRRHVVTRP